jgi:hypothetical protein
MFDIGAECTITLFFIGAFLQNQNFSFCIYLVRICTIKNHKTCLMPVDKTAGFLIDFSSASLNI